jgi:hypothetical protein
LVLSGDVSARSRAVAAFTATDTDAIGEQPSRDWIATLATGDVVVRPRIRELLEGFR